LVSVGLPTTGDTKEAHHPCPREDLGRSQIQSGSIIPVTLIQVLMDRGQQTRTRPRSTRFPRRISTMRMGSSR